jgi:hypothetical protein
MDAASINPTIASAVITTLGALGGTFLTVYFNVIRKAKHETVDIKVAAARASEKAVQFERDDSVPFNSEILFARFADQTIIKLPRKGGEYFGIVFMTGWLVGWTAAIFFVGSILLHSLISKEESGGMEWFPALFLSGWLIAAIAGEFAAINSLFKQFSAAFGRRFLYIAPEIVIDLNKILAFNIPKIYSRERMKNFRAESDGLVFEYGKNDIKMMGLHV